MYMPPGIAMLATLTEFASSSAGTILVITGAFAGGIRAWAVLRRFSADRIERETAIGFVVGAVTMILLVFVDKILKY
jgi:positive regulator of sigma E activity